VVDVESAAAILLEPGWEQPTLGAEFSAQLAPQLIVFIRGSG